MAPWRRLRKTGAALALAAALAAGGVRAAEPASRPLAPDFALNDLSGAPLRLKDLRGRVVLLDFWAAWCPSCRQSLPYLDELQKRYGGRGVEVVSVSEDDDPGETASFLRGRGLGQRVLLDRRGRAFRLFGARALPATFLIDAAGGIRARWLGLDSGGRRALESALQALTPPGVPAGGGS